jgi:uncharacterized RDD family membrane protein YckC
LSGVEEKLRTEAAQRDAIRRLRGANGPAPAIPGTPYAGFVTRLLAFSIDGAIIQGVAAFVAVVTALALSLLHLPSQVDVIVATVLGVAWVLWSVGYFVLFWSTTGQTPGNRVMAIVVLDSQGRGPLKPRRALLRFLALIAGAAALMIGILMMLWSPRRRCFQDRVARTVVLYVPPQSLLSRSAG